MSTSAPGVFGTPDETSLLEHATCEEPVAVVVDANAYGEVGPDVVRLASLAADLAKIGIKTWVPEPVAWEWAEHLAAQWTSARSVTKKPLKHLVRAGLDAMSVTPGYQDRGQVIETFLQNLAEIPHIEIIGLTGGSAVQGLKDQISCALLPRRKPATL